MKDHSYFTDEEFLGLFRSCELEEELFSHEAHLRLAWLNIKSLGLDGAVEQTRNDLWNYVDHLNLQDIYNETVTIAAVKTVSQFMQKSDGESFEDLMIEFPRLKNNFKDLLAKHYSVDIFNSSEAKKTYLEPDLTPFH